MSIRKIITKVILFNIIVLFSLLISGCEKIKFVYYDDASSFISLLEEYQIGNKTNGGIIDLRNYEAYLQGHIRNALSFDVNEYDKETFLEWVLTYFDKNTTLLVVDDGGDSYSTIVDWLKTTVFKEVHVFTKGYEILKQNQDFELKIYEATGEDPCGC